MWAVCVLVHNTWPWMGAPQAPPVRCLTVCVGEESGVPSLGPLLPGSLGHGACVAWRLEWGVLCLHALPACWKNLLPGEVPVLCCHLETALGPWRPLEPSLKPAVSLVLLSAKTESSKAGCRHGGSAH